MKPDAPLPPLESATVRVLKARTKDSIAMSFSALTHRTLVLVTLHGEDGHVGHGESWANYPPWAGEERIATLREGVLPRTLASTATTVRELYRELVGTLDPLGRQWGAPGPIRQAISAVDAAAWDLAGNAGDRSVATLLGGRVRDHSTVYASGLGPQAAAEQAADSVRAGHVAVKVKVGFGAEQDERTLTEARQAIGPDVTLRADANQGWDLDTAIAMAPLLRAADVGWIEEPLRGDRLADLEELHRRTGLPIATGENVYGLSGFRALAESPAIAFLQPDITKAGGLSEVLDVCELAEQHGKAVFPHLYGGAPGYAATLQLAACAPPVAGIEYDVRDNPLRDPLLCDAPTPRNGEVSLPDGPGLGIRLDLDAVERHTVAAAEVPAIA